MKTRSIPLFLTCIDRVYTYRACYDPILIIVISIAAFNTPSSDSEDRTDGHS